MIQGTMSSAGKSFVAAALCRIFRQDGYRVAPFKSQNMALNSFITQEGLEMGRAQVMQAEAAGIAPSVLMNPILLKPSSDTGSQVIVNGEVIGNFSAQEYYQQKLKLVPKLMEAYRQLESQYDILVLEGAGSPAEINLNQDDIVNMGMAKRAKAPVLLVGDIDRGGVFASLAGTMQLLTPSEQHFVKGILINKFRGDLAILQPGLEQIHQITKRPVLGVIPFLPLDLDDEDSLSERCNQSQNQNQSGLLDLAVIRLPRMSNFTDFNPLSAAEGVSLRYVQRVSQLKNPAMILLPGTKNTMEDLLWLRQSGLEAAILKLAAQGTVIFGICGGYQMLGQELNDPDGIEHGGTVPGMGLLPTVTVFTPQKTRTQVSGKFQAALSGVFQALASVPFTGYEIHMGKTSLLQDATLACQTLTTILTCNAQEVNQAEGLCSGTVFGTYLHGIFDQAEVVNALLRTLCSHCGRDPSKIAAVDLQKYKEQQYNLLADGVRNHIDMKAIYQILEEGMESECKD